MTPIRVTHQYNDGERIVIKLSDGSEAVALDPHAAIHLAGRIVNGQFVHMQSREIQRNR